VARIFLRNVKADFPGIKLILCDKQKGLDACHNIYPVVRFGRCARHLLENTKDPGNRLGKITQEWELQFWKMVKAPTVEGYKEAYAAALKINSIASRWVDARKGEFAEHIFIGEGIRRFGDSTSNMAEEMFAAWSHLDFKPLPIIQLHQKILVWQSQKMHSSRVTSQQANTETITPWMKDLLTQKFWDARTLHCTSVFCNDFNYTGLVEVKKSNPRRTIEVKLMQEPSVGADGTTSWNASGSCSCGRFKALGRPCKHVLAGLRAAASANGQKWNFLDLHWLHSAYHLVTWQHQYESLHFPTTAVEFQEEDRKDLLPPAMEKKRGRKGKEKSDEKQPDQKRVVVCKACGKQGHLMKTCPNPDAAKIARSFSTKLLPTYANYAEDIDGEIVNDAEQSTTREGELDARNSVAMVVTQEIARQMGTTHQKIRRVVVEFE
jgi:hypothetical protein